MQHEEDFWFWLAVLVSVAAAFIWALSSVVDLGEPIRWIAATIIVIAMLSTSVRAWLKARKIVWTPELREAQKRRARQQLAEIAATLPFPIIMLGILKLGREGMLAQWAGALLMLLSMAAWIGLGRLIRKRATRQHPS